MNTQTRTRRHCPWNRKVKPSRCWYNR